MLTGEWLRGEAKLTLFEFRFAFLLTGAMASVLRWTRSKGGPLEILRPTLDRPLSGDLITLKPIVRHDPAASAAVRRSRPNAPRKAKSPESLLPLLAQGAHLRTRSRSSGLLFVIVPATMNER